jgi:hypothetical protein
MNAQPTDNADPPDIAHALSYGYVSLRRDVSVSTIAIFESAVVHGFREGDAVLISGARIGGLPTNPLLPTYNDTVSVHSILSDKIFTYEMKNEAAANADPSTMAFLIRFAARWQIRRLVYEENICELYPYDSKSYSAPSGVNMIGYFSPPPHMFPDGIYRGNFFRMQNNSVLPPSSGSFAIGIGESQNTLVENNVIELTDPQGFKEFLSERTTAFNNVAPSGAKTPLYTLPAVGYVQSITVDERIAAAIEEAIVCSML